DELKYLTRVLGLEDKVHFPGFVSDDERNNLLSIASMAVFPSLYEPFGIVALEGMAAGKPVIVADTGGLGEIVSHGYNGLKFPPGDSNALAGAILTLLRSEELADCLTEQAFMDLRNLYDWDVLANQTSEVYERVAD
ncbi:MAG TPA: glycosyltransferase family 4 protein, partial [Bacillota bacterium]|nr:glycosyltransferase family 4 protein [Bacillota bacterium]